MQFDLAATIKAIKVSLTTAQKARGPDINTSISLALDDLSLRLRSKSFMTDYTLTVADAKREVELRGDNDDLRSIFALQIGSGVDQTVLDFVELNQFLRDHNSTTAAAGIPTKFTQTTANEGYPTVRFNKPLDGAQSLKVYYYLELSGENISASRSISAVVQGSLAYFHGLGSPQGQIHYKAFEDLAASSKGADSFVPETLVPIEIPRQDKLIKRTQNALRAQRR